MEYGKIIKGKFISRPNRFVAKVEINGSEQDCHVKNTGRCKELLIPNATVYLEDFSQEQKRKLKYSLVAVEKGERLINMDSQAPNKVVYEALLNGEISLDGMGKLKLIKPESSFLASRFDFFVEDEFKNGAYVEVKGVTLESDGVVSFPDAPTERGVKHLNELSKAIDKGFLAYVIFVIQMEGVSYFTPNVNRHLEFATTLNKVAKSGVKVLAYDCLVTKSSLKINREVKVRL